MAVLHLHFCVWAFSSCGKRGPLFIVVCGPLTVAASLVAGHRLQMRRLSSCGSRGLVAPGHVGSSQTRAQTHVPCIGRQILNHCATREALKNSLYKYIHKSGKFFLGLSWKVSLGHYPFGARGSPSKHHFGYRFFFFFFFSKFIYLFIYFWLCWVFVSVQGLSLVSASGGHSSSWCAGLSLSRPLLLRSIGSRRAGSVVVAHGPSCSAACGIFRDQGSNPCPLHWQADSQPLHHQGSPIGSSLKS